MGSANLRALKATAIGVVICLAAAAACSGGQPAATTSAATSSASPRTDDHGTHGYGLVTVELGGGRELQAWLDTSGGQFHLTFFDDRGQELAVDTFDMHLSNGDREVPVVASRFGSGHFVAMTQLAPGTWTGQVEGATSGGEDFAGSFTLEVPAG